MLKAALKTIYRVMLLARVARALRRDTQATRVGRRPRLALYHLPRCEFAKMAGDDFMTLISHDWGNQFANHQMGCDGAHKGCADAASSEAYGSPR